MNAVQSDVFAVMPTPSGVGLLGVTKRLALACACGKTDGEPCDSDD